MDNLLVIGGILLGTLFVLHLPFLWYRYARRVTCHKCGGRCRFLGFSLGDTRAYRCERCKEDYAMLCGGFRTDKAIPEHRLWM
jgi:hypothetical protein